MPSDEDSTTGGGAPQRTVHLVFSRWMILLLAAAVVLPWLMIAFLLSSRNSETGKPKSSLAVARAQDIAPAASARSLADPRPQEWFAGRKGPWGQFESMMVAIDLPDELLVMPPADAPPIRWSFPGYTKDKALTTLRSAGLPEEDVKNLESSAKWSDDEGVAVVEPGDRLILSLAPEVRAKLYAILDNYPQNARQTDPIWFLPGEIDWQVQGSGLAPESIGLLKRLLYPQGKSALLFADFEPALRSLPNDAERKRFMKTVSRKRAVVARLNLDPASDVEQISQYWGIGGRRKDLLPLLNALHRVEKGCTLNMVCLLPTFPREHLYTFSFAATDAKGAKQDSFWTAFNFFNDPPDSRFSSMDYIQGVLDQDFYQVNEPSQLGDLVFITGENKSVIHVAAYVADDLVFTKNGDDVREPWVLMHMPGMMEAFAVKHPNATLKQQFYRRKSL